MTDKLDLESMNIAKDKQDKLKALFPEVFSEGKIDFDRLRATLGDIVDETNERYEMNWAGKKNCFRAIQEPSRATLKPVKDDSVDFDTTENLYIEGDNLEVLKLLQKSYFEKVKMIYIDPPYNTGNDFIYPDDYKDNLKNYLELTGQVDSDGKKIKTNVDTDGRYHSNWMNMMYPRLFLARNLLREDGVIFISIDDNEVHNLRKLCDEIFGEENFINLLTVKTKIGGVSGSSEGKSLKDTTEFTWIYAKNKNNLLLSPVYIKTPLFDRIKSYEEEGKSWKYTSILTKLEGKTLLKNDEVRGMKFYGYNTVETMSITAFARENGLSIEDVYNQFADRIFQTTNAQSSVRQTLMDETQELNYEMFGLEYVPIKGKNGGNLIEVLYKGEQRRMMMFLADAVEKIDGIYYYMDKVTTLWDDIEYNNLTKEGNIEFSNGKKPLKMVERLLKMDTDFDSIILDFFSGSATTAHAVMDLNAQDGGNRKFIMVQLPEPTDESSEAFKAGYKNICEIGKERIRRAGKKIKEQLTGDSGQLKLGEEVQEVRTLDTGFRVFRLDKSNFNIWQGENVENLQQALFSHVEHINKTSTEEDILFELILKAGYSINDKVTEHIIEGKKVYSLFEDAVLISLEKNLTKDFIKAIADMEPLKVILLDEGFNNNDALKTNAVEIMKSKKIEDFRTV